MNNKNTVITCTNMGLSHSDFFRVYPRLFPESNTILRTEGAVSCWSSGERVNIRLSKERTRILGLLRFPIVDIELTIVCANKKHVGIYMKTFHQGFQKGGG